MDKVLKLATDWIELHKPKNSKLHVFEESGRTPLILLDIAGSSTGSSTPKTVLMYGHLDKQPEMTGWRQGLSPWEPVLEGEKLYGRGGADDGYALFASLCAVKAMQDAGLSHPRVVILVEFCEESGSLDLPFYVNKYVDLIGTPSLVVCLDSGAGNYDQLWCTTSLRGLVGGTLRVDVLNEGVHSGDASGIVASSFRVARQLLSHIENESTGEVLVKDLYCKIPDERISQAKEAAKVLQQDVYSKFPFVEGMKPMKDDLAELILNRTWRPALSITGQAGLPELQNAGNVLRPYTSLQLSMRLPPLVNGELGKAALIKALQEITPYNAKVTLNFEKAATGWDAPKLTPWLHESLQSASQNFYGKTMLSMGEGGTIPFMGMLGEKFPQAQFVVTGVLGPNSNAHGPNEFLHLGYAKKLTGCITQVLRDFQAANS